MTDSERTENLGTLFVSVTGDTSVVEQQRDGADTRVVDGGPADRTVDAVEHHGLDDAIDEPAPADEPV